jgi:hypothetical protein
MGQLIPHQFGALLAGVEHRSVSYVRLRLWLENKRLSDESIFLPIQPEILGQDVICQKFSEWEIQFRFRGPLLQHPPSPSSARPTSLTLVLYFSVELSEPYHSLPIKQWRKVMRANRKSYATGAVRAWLRGRHKIRLQQQPFSMVA